MLDNLTISLVENYIMKILSGSQKYFFNNNSSKDVILNWTNQLLRDVILNQSHS